MRAYNFTKLNKREGRVYAFGDINLSKSGIPSKFLGMAAILAAISLAINWIIGSLIGDVYVDPFRGEALDLQPLAFVIGIPVAIAAGLYFIKVNSYRLVDFLVVYFSPKKPIDAHGKKVKNYAYKIDAFLENCHLER